MMRSGQSFTLNGVQWTVAYVTPSRAHCVSNTKRVVTVTDRLTGRPRTFVATDTKTLDISPDSQLGLLKAVLS